MQVGKLGRDYSRWLHTPEPVVRPRFFANPLLEAVTATEWCLPPPASCLGASMTAFSNVLRGIAG